MLEDILHRPHHKVSASVLYPKFINPHDVVVEVGTYRGGGTLLLSRLASQVYSFEPIRELYARTVRNTQHKKNIEVFNTALGNSNTTTFVNLYKKSGTKVLGYSSISDRTAFKKSLEICGKETVKMERLEDHVFSLAPTALVSDCEGAEVEVMKGASSLLPSLRLILVEVHNTKESLIDFLSNFPFKITYGVDYPSWLVALNDSSQESSA